eukprot:9819070-Heterocapsa_arctica.AAC.1
MHDAGARLAVQIPHGAQDGSVAVLRRADSLARRLPRVGDEFADLAPCEFPVPTDVAVPVEFELGL